MKRAISLAVIVALAIGAMPVSAGQERRSDDPVSALREAARQIPLGTKVRITLRSGEHHRGTLRAAGESGVMIDWPAGREENAWGQEVSVPAGSIEVAYDTMQSIKREGMRWWAKLAIVWGAAAAGIIIFFAASGLGSD